MRTHIFAHSAELLVESSCRAPQCESVTTPEKLFCSLFDGLGESCAERPTANATLALAIRIARLKAATRTVVVQNATNAHAERFFCVTMLTPTLISEHAPDLGRYIRN